MVAKDEGDRMSSQFTLDGVGNEGSGNGEFCCPHDVTVLGLSGEVAVVDVSNNCVQIFDSSEGNYKLQFGSYGARNVIIKWPDVDTALEFYNSENYKEAMSHGVKDPRNPWVSIEINEFHGLIRAPRTRGIHRFQLKSMKFHKILLESIEFY